METPNTEEPIRVLSLGCGVQSSTLALLLETTDLLPKVDCAVFSDVGAEPLSVYDWLDYLRTQVSYPIYQVMEKDGLLTNIESGLRDGKRWSNPPFFTKNDEGKKGMLMRTCTYDYKIRPIRRKLKELIGLTKYARLPKEVRVINLMGISTDEIQRKRFS